MNTPVFVCGRRTVFGKAFKGCFKDVRPDDLAVELLRSYQTSANDLWNRQPQDLIAGCAYPEGEQGYNVARTIALGCGLDTPGLTINRLCASSLEAVAIAASRVKAGWGTRFLVAGVESMSRIPRRGSNFSESDLIKGTNPQTYTPNGTTAEKVANQYPEISRQIQEDFAARSHELADAAYNAGNYSKQLHSLGADRDEFIRVPVDREKMASLTPAFDENGVVTAATSSPLTDGATSGWVVDTETAKSCGINSGLEIIDATIAHVQPDVMGMGPVPATKLIFERNSVDASNIDAFEINEAFAIQVLASMQELNIPLEKTNAWGGAMALGHPLGASGLRLLMTLHDRLALADKEGALGLATLCVGGGQGMSVLCRYVTFG